MASLTKIETALKARPLQDVCRQSLDEATSSAASEMPRAVEREKRCVLQDAARQLVKRLGAWRPASRFSELQRAILALHFTFASGRQGLGGLDMHRLRHYQSVIEDSTGQDILQAVRSLVRENALLASDFEVFRYTPTVWRTVEQCKKSGDWERDALVAPCEASIGNAHRLTE